MELDGRDQKLLMLLQEDCRIPNAELAGKVGMSASACWRRVRTLEENGVIERFGAILDPEKSGLHFRAIVLVQLVRHDPELQDEFIRAVQSKKEIMECYATTGQADYHLRVLCSDLADFNRFLDDFLFRLKAVQSAQTHLVLKELKRGRRLLLQ